MGCKKCTGFMGLLLLFVGLIYLISDLSSWNFNVSWYTAAFLAVGFGIMAVSNCELCTSKVSKKK